MKVITNELFRVFLSGSPLSKIIFLLLALLALPAQSAEYCADEFYIDVTLPNGARWDLCWEHRTREAIVYHHVFYTPQNSSHRRMVFFQASVAQIHVPYDDNGARFHDVSDFGLGGVALQPITAESCPNGSLIAFSTKNVICQQIVSRQQAYSLGGQTQSGHALHLFNLSESGNYIYIPLWKFFDDGSIEPWMGATGALQRFTNASNHQHGWTVSQDANQEIGIAHLHNYYWRLDFDLGNTNDDYVEEINFELNNGVRTRQMTRFNTEVSRPYNPLTYRTWRVVDDELNSNGHATSYEIILQDMGHRDHGPAIEPFTRNDFYLTHFKDCERFASHNPTEQGACARNLSGFVNAESIAGKDTVIWASATFYHMPRSEDMPHMDAHWSHMLIKPRDWHASNPLVDGSVQNSPPVITNPGNQSSTTSDAVSLAIQATDVDGDALSYSATGLPLNLSINASNGLISGVLQGAGSFSPVIVVSDGTASQQITFNWTVVPLSSGAGSIMIRSWKDINSNGLRDANDTSIPNVLAWLFSVNWEWLAENVTNSNGQYEFSSLPDGGYYICFDPATYPENLSTTVQNAGDDSIDSDVFADGCSDLITVSTGIVSHVDIGLASGVTQSLIGNFIWLDQNGNGLQESNEPGVSAMTVWLFDQNWNWRAETQTDANGGYSFNAMPAGGYHLCANLLDAANTVPTLMNAGDDALDSDAEVDGCTALFNIEVGEVKTSIDIGLVNN
jgi:hypothetical protein